ncbi:unnamed protein product [Boreogadus saida]
MMYCRETPRPHNYTHKQAIVPREALEPVTAHCNAMPLERGLELKSSLRGTGPYVPQDIHAGSVIEG